MEKPDQGINSYTNNMNISCSDGGNSRQDLNLSNTYSSNSNFFNLEWNNFGAYNLTQVQKHDARPIKENNGIIMEHNHLYELSVGKSSLESIDLDTDLLKLKAPLS